MEKFLVFQFDRGARIYFTKVESEFSDDPCRHYVLEIAVGKQSETASSILITEHFEIFEWSISELSDQLKQLYDFKLQQVDIKNDEGQGMLTLKLTKEKKVDILLQSCNDIAAHYDISFRIRADQTVINQFLVAINR